MAEKKLRKIMIVVEEDGSAEGKGFKLYLDGDKERLTTAVEPTDVSPAEFWGSRLFQICVSAVRQAGAVQSERLTQPEVKI